jgi:hypothetical protein
MFYIGLLIPVEYLIAVIAPKVIVIITIKADDRTPMSYPMVIANWLATISAWCIVIDSRSSWARSTRCCLLISEQQGNWTGDEGVAQDVNVATVHVCRSSKGISSHAIGNPRHRRKQASHTGQG